MKNIFFIVLILMVSRVPGYSREVQTNLPGSVDLNQLILKVANRGDSALAADNFILAEKIYLNACSYTDTLVRLLLEGKPNAHFTFSRKKIHLYVFSYEKLARLYQMAGNIKRADEFFTFSIKQRQLLFSARSVHRIYPYVGLGQLYFQADNFDKALHYFSEGSRLLDRATTTNFNFDVLRYQLYGFHFETSLQKGRYREAFRFLQRYFYALNTIAPTHEQVATAFEMKARYFLLTGNNEQTSYYLKRAEKSLPRNSATFSKAEVSILRTKALFHWSIQKSDSALQVFRNMLDVYKSNIQRNFPALSEYEREQFFVMLKKDFDLFNSFVAQSIQAGSAREVMMSTLYDTQLFTKALLLNEITKSIRAIEASGDQALISKFQEWQKAKEQISTLYYTNKKAAVEISQLEQRINSLEKEINQKSNYLSKGEGDIRWQQIRDHLSTKEAALEIIRTKVFHIDSIRQRGIQFSNDVQYLVLIVRPSSQSPEGFLLPLGNALETKYLAQYRNSIRQQLKDTVSYGRFWEPIRDHLQNSDHVYFSADGVYNQINPNVLYNSAAGRYVLDEITIFSVTNTKDILLKRERGELLTASLFGRPAYSGIAGKETSLLNQNRGIRALGDRDLMDFSEQEFIDLPGTEREVESIEEVFNSHQLKTQIFLNESATEENIKSLQSPRVLHIATHGFFLQDDGQHINSMIRSGIILSGVKNRSSQLSQDGILTAYEATGLTLEKTDLVVLSACETGLGEVKNGEGVYGLQRGLKVAGAKNLLMSLWKVDDEATAQLMIDFYRHWLKDASIHDAFRQAQLDLRKTYENPFYWGAFILIGN